MTISICGSMTFAKEMLVLRDQLQEAGFNVIVPLDAETYANDPAKLEQKWVKQKPDLIHYYHKEIARSDAILVLNLTKNSVANYIGGNAFLEMGFAHVLHKPIYLFHPVPELPYRDEMAAMQPIVINGDLSRIHA